MSDDGRRHQNENFRVIDAIDLESRILSLDYNGYFTHNIFEVLKDKYRLLVGFRLHPERNQESEDKNKSKRKFHYYGCTKEWAGEFLKMIHRDQTDQDPWQVEMKDLTTKWKEWEKKGPEARIKIVSSKNVGRFRIAGAEKEIDITAVFDLPLWVGVCRTWDCLVNFCGLSNTYEGVAAKPRAVCHRCGGRLRRELRGVIRLYSEYPYLPQSKIGLNSFNEKWKLFAREVGLLFAAQEEPDCYGYKDGRDFRPLFNCRHCLLNSRCGTPLESAGKDKDLLTPDELLRQLQQRCRIIMGPEYEFPVMLYDSKRRELRYRAVDYLELSQDWRRVLELLRPLYRELRDTILSDSKIANLIDDIELIFENSQELSFEKLRACAGKILGEVGQPITAGLRKHIWDSWMSTTLHNPYPPEELEDPAKYLKKMRKEIAEGKIDGREIIRDYIERLFLMGTEKNILQELIITPIGYLGQKAGLLFTMIRSQVSHKRSVHDKAVFLRISREFSPLLFKSIQYQTYRNALDKLEEHTIKDTPWILLSVLPQFLNIIAAAFWTENQIGKMKKADTSTHNFEIPHHLFMFQPNPGICAPADFNQVCLSLERIEKEGLKSLIWSREFGNDTEVPNYQSPSRSRIWWQVQELEPQAQAQIYSKAGICVRSRLLLSMQVPEVSSDVFHPEAKGVFAFYFDLSPYVLQRNAMELGKEIAFLFTQTIIAAHQKQRALTHASKSASTGIMARNLAHNIGSHVLSYWVQRMTETLEKGNLPGDLYNEGIFNAAVAHVQKSLSTLRNAIQDPASGEDERIIGRRFADATQNTEIMRKILEKAMHARRDLAENLSNSRDLVKYLKQRMDFIAEITTTTPTWEKTFLINSHILEPFVKQSAIIHNIAKSEGFCAFGCCNRKKHNRGGGCEGCPFLPASAKDDDCSRKSDPEPLEIVYNEQSMDYPVAIPQGIVGKHAFFSILENFIRNSAKHGGRYIRDRIKKGQEPSGRLRFLVTAEEVEDYPEHIRVTISDNIGNCNLLIDQPGGIKERVCDKLSKAIEDREYVDARGMVRRGNWGIKEIKLSANFLRKRRTEPLFWDQVDKPPLVHLSCYDQCSSGQGSPERCASNVAICFYLRKPREVCVVSEDGSTSKNERFGISVWTREELLKRLKEGDTVPHRFLVLDRASHEDSEIWKHREQLPMRVLVYGDRETTSHGPAWKAPAFLERRPDEITTRPREFILKVYRTYVVTWVPEGYKMIVLYDRAKANEELVEAEPTEAWFLPRDDGSRPAGIFDTHENMKRESGAKERFSSLDFYHGVSAATSFGKLLEQVHDMKPVDRGILRWELMETALVKVMVADERIWNNFNAQQEALKLMGIEMVPVRGESITPEDEESLLKREDCTFLVIHKGIIEKMPNPPEGKKSFIQRAIDTYPYVVIDSGRGEPEMLEPGTRYVPMGAIEEFLADRDKHSLIQTLFSLRRAPNAVG